MIPSFPFLFSFFFFLSAHLITLFHHRKQAEVLYKDVLSLKDAEEAEMKARKRKSRVSVSSHNGPPPIEGDAGARFS